MSKKCHKVVSNGFLKSENMATTQIFNNKWMLKQLGSIQFVGYYVAIKYYTYEDFNDKWNFYDKNF